MPSSPAQPQQSAFFYSVLLFSKTRSHVLLQAQGIYCYLFTAAIHYIFSGILALPRESIRYLVHAGKPGEATCQPTSEQRTCPSDHVSNLVIADSKSPTVFVFASAGRDVHGFILRTRTRKFEACSPSNSYPAQRPGKMGTLIHLPVPYKAGTTLVDSERKSHRTQQLETSRLSFPLLAP